MTETESISTRCPCGRPVHAGSYCLQHLEEYHTYNTVGEHAVVPEMPRCVRHSMNTLTTRRAAGNLADRAGKLDDPAIDLSNLEFISRAAADELLVRTDNSNISLDGASGDVAGMIDVVRESRASME